MSDTMLLAGERYKALEMLGEGGMGAVYLVEDRVRSERLALKVMSTAGEIAEAELLHFKQEFRAMASLSHPNLCAVYDYGLLPDGAPFFTMEYVPGQDLLEAVPADVAGMLPLIGQLGRALGYLHKQGFVHCDLKPENVRVRTDGTLKLMDFGLLAPTGQALPAIRGTLAYISPEIAKLDRIDQRSDLYSLGVVLYELLAGERPIRGASALEVLRAHLNVTPRPIREVRPDLPEDLGRLITALLAKEPIARPKSALEVQRWLGLDAEGTDSQSLLASPFVGRQAELERFREVLGQVCSQRSGVQVRLQGDAGIGKGRLIRELRFMVQLENKPFLHGQCPAERVAYGPWLPVLRALVPLAREKCPQTLIEQAPILAQLLEELHDGVARERLDPDQERILIQRAISRVVCDTLGDAGAVLVFEHWDQADPASVEALAYLVRNASNMGRGDQQMGLAVLPLMVVLSGVEVAGEGEAITLAGLSRGDVERMLEGALGQVGLPDALVTQFYELSGGNPRLVETILEHAIAMGAIGRVDGGWTVPAKLAAEVLATDVRQLLAERLRQLSPDARIIARRAAVLGQSFNLKLAAGVLELPDEELFGALVEMVQVKVLDLADGGYRFTLSELRELLDSELDDVERQRLHLAAAVCIEAGCGPEGRLPLAALDRVARHYVAAGNAERGIGPLLEAAKRNEELFNFPAVDLLLDAGTRMLDGLPDTREWWGLKCDYMTALAASKRRNSANEEAQSWGEHAAKLAAELGDRRRLLVAKAELALTAAAAGSHADAVELNISVIELARELGDASQHARAGSNLGRNYQMQGKRELALATLLDAVEAGKGESSRIYYGRALANMGHLQAIVPATREDGFRNLAAAVSAQVQNSDLWGEIMSHLLMGDLLLETGRYPEALKSNEACVALGREFGTLEDLICGHLNVALCSVEMGLFVEASAALVELNHLPGVKASPTYPIALALEVLVAAAQGNFLDAQVRLKNTGPLVMGALSYVFLAALPVILDAQTYLSQPLAALAFAQEALFKVRSAPDKRGSMFIALAIAAVYVQQGQWERAAEQVGQAETIVAELDHKGGEVKLLRLKAAVALGREQFDDASHFAARGQGLAGLLSMRPEQALLSELQGEIALAMKPADIAHFLSMQALADGMGAPFLRARALYGQMRCKPKSAEAAMLLAEAQRVIGELAAPLDQDAKQDFFGSAQCRAILAQNPAVRSVPSEVEGGQEIGQRFSRMTEELQGLAVQYEMLLQESKVNNEQLRKLNELGSRMNGSLRLEEVLRQVVLLTLEITRAQRGFVVLKKRGRYRDLVCREALDNQGNAVPVDSFSLSITNKVLAAGKAIAILDASKDVEFSESKSILALDIKTVMGIPLKANDEMLGVLYVDSQAVLTTFTEKDLELMRAIANHASIAIDNATLYEDLNRHAKELEKAIELHQMAEREANTDVLTGIANRRCFLQHTSREFGVAQRYGDAHCVIMLDVDHFKSFNDTYGHAVGDGVLKAIGSVFAGCVRETDLAARLGGEEFVVYCPNTTADDAVIVAERIREAISCVRLTDADGNPVRQLTASLGITQALREDTKIDELLERSDIALYECKRNGRNQVKVWRPGMVGEH
jgi:diguanylate cyclase (GGDEF)-like protein